MKAIEPMLTRQTKQWIFFPLLQSILPVALELFPFQFLPVSFLQHIGHYTEVKVIKSGITAAHKGFSSSCLSSKFHYSKDLTALTIQDTQKRYI